MVRAGCVFVAGIHPSRTWTSGSIESVRWNVCVHRLDLGLYSHPKEFLGGMEFEPMLTPREKSPLLENFPRGGSNPRRCGQRVQTLPTSYSGPELQLRTIVKCILCQVTLFQCFCHLHHIELVSWVEIPVLVDVCQCKLFTIWNAIFCCWEKQGEI